MQSILEHAREICKNNELELIKEASILGISLDSYKKIISNKYGRSPFNFITVRKP